LNYLKSFCHDYFELFCHGAAGLLQNFLFDSIFSFPELSRHKIKRFFFLHLQSTVGIFCGELRIDWRKDRDVGVVG